LRRGGGIRGKKHKRRALLKKAATLEVEVERREGVNFINALQAAFSRADPKSVKKTHNLTVFLRIWDLGESKLLIGS